MACQHLDQIDQVIAVLGGRTALAELTQRQLTTIMAWRLAGRFPPSTYRMLTTELHDRGFTASVKLWDFETLPSEDDGELTA